MYLEIDFREFVAIMENVYFPDEEDTFSDAGMRAIYDHYTNNKNVAGKPFIVYPGNLTSNFVELTVDEIITEYNLEEELQLDEFMDEEDIRDEVLDWLRGQTDTVIDVEKEATIIYDVF